MAFQSFRRRRRKLSWSHHLEVLPCEPEVADTWLDTAEAKVDVLTGVK